MTSFNIRTTIQLNGNEYLNVYLKLDSDVYPTVKEFITHIISKYNIEQGYYKLYKMRLAQDPYNIEDDYETKNLNGYMVTLNFFSSP